MYWASEYICLSRRVFIKYLKSVLWYEGCSVVFKSVFEVFVVYYFWKYQWSRGGLVGYDAALTQLRSRVQFPALVFLPRPHTTCPHNTHTAPHLVPNLEYAHTFVTRPPHIWFLVTCFAHIHTLYKIWYFILDVMWPYCYRLKLHQMAEWTQPFKS